MKKGGHFFPVFSDDIDSVRQSVSKQTIVELFGSDRVLIENHSGVCQYSGLQIGILVSYGILHVCGCDLELTYMTKERLVITGRIQSVALIRRIKD